MKAFYVSKAGGETEGPWEREELARQMMTGELQRTDLVCLEGGEDWQTAASVLAPAAVRVRPARGSRAWVCLALAGLSAVVVAMSLRQSTVPEVVAAMRPGPAVAPTRAEEPAAAPLPRVSHALLGRAEIAKRYGRVLAAQEDGRMTYQEFRFKDYKIVVAFDGERWMGEVVAPKPARKLEDGECLLLARAIAAEGEWEQGIAANGATKWEHQSGEFFAMRPLSFVGSELLVMSKDYIAQMQAETKAKEEKRAEGF